MLDYSLKLFNFSIKESLNLSLGCDWGWREDGEVCAWLPAFGSRTGQ